MALLLCHPTTKDLKDQPIIKIVGKPSENRCATSNRTKLVVVKRVPIVAFLVAALLVSVAGAACPPLAAKCPMHSAQEGCGGATPRKPDHCCPGTSSAESSSIQTQFLRPLQLSADSIELPVDFRPALEAQSLGESACAASACTDLSRLFGVLLL